MLPKKTQEREISLLMHYLDDVFPEQFPFHDTPYVGKREWLLTILTSTRPVYYATLSLSLLHKEASLGNRHPGLSKVWQGEKTKYYILALRESQQLLHEMRSAFSENKIKGNIHALASTIQLISYESSSLSKGDWQLHLHAGASLIPALVESWKMVVKSGQPRASIWSLLDASDFDAMHDVDVLSFEYVGALRFLTNVLAVFGILSCISTGLSSPFTDYHYLMNDHDGLIQIDQVVGCKNWAMLAILEVGILDKWKREAQDNCRLSLKELSRRALSIEANLENGLQETSGSNTPVDVVTGIYGTAALTYLHSVVSGLNPHLAEIQESVTRTINLLRRLPDGKMIAGLVWPLCITGCLATPDQQNFIKGLIGSVSVSPHTLRGCWSALKVMEDAWKLQDQMSQQSSITWESILCHSGSPVLLI